MAPLGKAAGAEAAVTGAVQLGGCLGLATQAVLCMLSALLLGTIISRCRTVNSVVLGLP